PIHFQAEHAQGPDGRASGYDRASHATGGQRKCLEQYASVFQAPGRACRRQRNRRESLADAFPGDSRCPPARCSKGESLMKRLLVLLTVAVGAGGLLAGLLFSNGGRGAPDSRAPERAVPFKPREDVDTNGVNLFLTLPPWKDPTALEQIGQTWLEFRRTSLA